MCPPINAQPGAECATPPPRVVEKHMEDGTRLTMKTPNTPEDAPCGGESFFRPPFNIKSWIRDILVAFFIAIFIIVFVVQPVKVEGTSMEPVLMDQERIFVNRFIYQFKDISRGDVVVFRYPRDHKKSFIKRVLAVPGDEVEIRAGMVYLNGRRYEEPYVPPEFGDKRSYPRTIVPPGRYFVLGDHRSSSNDSRNWGFVEKQLIYGKAFFCYWPVAHFGLVK